MYLRFIFLTTVYSIFVMLLNGCSTSNNCRNIRNARIYANSPVKIGETIHFGTAEVGGYRIYEWRGPKNYNDQYPSDSITGAQLENEGWYFLHLYSLDGDCEKNDSVYVDVQLLQGSPSCNTSSNTADYSNMGTDAFNSITKRVESTYSNKALIAYGGAANLSIYFHPRWRDLEPEDGIYQTYDVTVFDPIDNNYNKVFITTTKNSIYWSSNANQSVYVSHVNGKLQVRFCNLQMGGNNGSSFTTFVSGNLLEQ